MLAARDARDIEHDVTFSTVRFLMTKEFLHENHVTTKRTGTPSSFVADGVRIDMRRLSSHDDAGPTKKDRPRPKAKKASKAKPAKTTPAE